MVNTVMYSDYVMYDKYKHDVSVQYIIWYGIYWKKSQGLMFVKLKLKWDYIINRI